MSPTAATTVVMSSLLAGAVRARVAAMSSNGSTGRTSRFAGILIQRFDRGDQVTVVTTHRGHPGQRSGIRTGWTLPGSGRDPPARRMKGLYVPMARLASDVASTMTTGGPMSVRMRRRRAVKAVAALAALIAISITLVGTPPASAGASGVLFGSLVATRGNETFAQAVARQDATYGTPTPMPISRVFYNGAPQPWPG